MITDTEAAEYVDQIWKHFQDKLSEWEHGFVSDQRARTRFSEKQRAVIDKIMERCAAQHGRNWHD